MNNLDIYISNSRTFEDFAHQFSSLFNVQLAFQSVDNRFLFRYYLSDVEIILFNEHGMEDDLGIAFSEYEFCLSFVKLDSGGSSNEYNELYDAMVKYYFAKLSQNTNSKCILVENSQHIISQTK